MTATATTQTARPAPSGPWWIQALAGLPCVAEVDDYVSNLDIDEVTALLRAAAYFPLHAAGRGPAPRPGPPPEAGFVMAAPARRLAVAAVESAGRLLGRDAIGETLGELTLAWAPIPEAWSGDPECRAPAVALDPARSQRLEVSALGIGFTRGGAFSAYGTGRSVPRDGGGLRLAAELAVVAAEGGLAGLDGAVSLVADVEASGSTGIDLVARFMDPEGRVTAAPPTAPAGARERGVTTLAFLGEVDPAHPVTLRFSDRGGLLGSNVYERLRLAVLDASDGAAGPRGGATAGAARGAVSAKLAFDPLSLCPVSPIQTFDGVFAFEDAAGRPIATLAADMTEGRALRTSLAGAPLPVFRFTGFGAIRGGTGQLAGATGTMTMNSAISVFPRTLANCYLLRLDDPDGRWRATLGSPA